MFGLFKTRKSPIRRRVEGVPGVRRTWIEWSIENGTRTPTLVVEYEYDLDPASPDYDGDVFAGIMSAAEAADPDETAPPRLRVVPRTSEG